MDKLMQMLESVASCIKSKISQISFFISEKVKECVDRVRLFFDNFSGNLKRIAEILSSVKSSILSVAEYVIKQLFKWRNSLIQEVKKLWSKMNFSWDNIKKTTEKESVDPVKLFFHNFSESLKKEIAEILSSINSSKLSVAENMQQVLKWHSLLIQDVNKLWDKMIVFWERSNNENDDYYDKAPKFNVIQQLLKWLEQYYGDFDLFELLRLAVDIFKLYQMIFDGITLWSVILQEISKVLMNYLMTKGCKKRFEELSAK